MAKRRDWQALAPSTRKRYLAKGRKLGQTEQQVIAFYEGGGFMGAHRGHRKHPGASEREWAALMRAAKVAKLDTDVEHGDSEQILESMLSKGYKPREILHWLEEKRESRGTYRSTLARSQRSQGIDAGWQPGRRRYYARPLRADIELFYYH